MTFNKKSKGHRYFDSKLSMILQKSWGWDRNPDNGKGDALWRTGLAYITWGKEELKKGVLGCFRKFKMINTKRYLYQVARASDRYREDDASRDQTILGLASLKINNDNEELNNIVKGLPFRISRRFFFTLNTWFWVKSLNSESKFRKLFANISLLMQLPLTFFQVSLNMIIEKILNYETMPIEQYSGLIAEKKKSKFNWFEKILDKLIWRSYATHLVCWRLWTTDVSKNNILLKLNQKILLSYIEKDNYLLRMLLKDEVDINDIKAYKPMDNWRWSIRPDGSRNVYFNQVSEEWKDKELKYNQMDRDILFTIYKINNNNNNNNDK